MSWGEETEAQCRILNRELSEDQAYLKYKLEVVISETKGITDEEVCEVLNQLFIDHSLAEETKP